MSRRRTQRYRAEIEFVLRDRSDYALVRSTLRSALLQLSHDTEMQIEFMSIEATEDTKVVTATDRAPKA